MLVGFLGSGKTTLLLALGGMLRPTTGSVMVGDTDLYGLSPRERAAFRAKTIGFVFQMFHLVPYLTVLENVRLGCHPDCPQGKNGSGVERAENLLRDFGIAQRQHHRPSELSAGEKQRAAIARAMINAPRLILADEPTGNLDPRHARIVGELMIQLQQEENNILIVVTHSAELAKMMQRGLFLRDGELVEDTPMTQQMARRRMHAAISAFGGFEAPIESPEE